MPPLVALTGATGYVGRFVVARLHEQNFHVRALARPSSDTSGFPGPFDWIAGDLRSKTALARLVEGADAVVHLAYEHIPGRYRGGEGDNLAEWLDANLNGSLALLFASQAAGAKCFIFLSSRAVFSGTEPGRALDESHPTAPDSNYGAYKAAVEAFLHSASIATGVRTYALRATGVYGVGYPVERSKWWPLIDAVVRDLPIESRGGGSEVHGDDVAAVVATLLNRTDIPSGPIHLSDRVVTHREIVRLARGFARKPGPLPEEPVESPRNLLVCRRLAELGLALSGQSALERTIERLVVLAQARAQGI